MATKSEFHNQLWEVIGGHARKADEERINTIISFVPEDCKTILDVGCGDGRVTNIIESDQQKNVVGLDISTESLKHVICPTICASADSIPSVDQRYDLVICNEILEHLSFQSYPKAIDEIRRVASKYILVSVPVDQDLRAGMVRCPHCGCQFIPSRHVRSFSKKKAMSLFGDFIAQRYELVGPWTKHYSRMTAAVAKKFGLLGKWSNSAVCPQCNYNTLTTWKPEIEASNKSPILATIRIISKAIMPVRKKPTFIVVLFERTLYG